MSAAKLGNLILREIKRQQLSQYRIALDTGVPQPCLSKFMNGGSLKMETAFKLLDYLGFEIRPKAAA